VIIIPIFIVGTAGAWFNLSRSNVTFSNIVLYHTYNYANWRADLSNSSPLMFVAAGSKLTIDNSTITCGERGVTYANPLILGWSDGGSVEIRYTSIMDISLTRVSLFYDYYSTSYIVSNVTFRYDDLSFFLLFFLSLMLISNISSVGYSSGAIYSSDTYALDYRFNFQNCSFSGLTTNSSMGGAITVYPEYTNLTINNCIFSDITLQNMVVSGGYVYVTTNPGEIHITNSIFARAAVFRGFYVGVNCFIYVGDIWWRYLL
jgi:hypothetical protein